MLCALCVAVVPDAVAADKQQISRAIAKEMMAAQKALQASQWQDAIKNLDDAEAKSGLTPFDKKTILDFKGFAYAKLGNMKAAQENYDKALATGLYPPDEAAKLTRMLFRLSAGSQMYPKALEYGKQIADNGTATADDLSIMAQIYFIQKDCKDTDIWVDKAVAASRKAGEAPKENVYQFKLQCAFDSNDTPGTIAALEDLIRLTGKADYWNKLLRFELQDEKEDRNILMIYRVMYNTGSMTAGSNFMEMAQLLGDAALPGEAQAVLEKGTASNVFNTPETKDRAARLVAVTKPRADADRKGLAEFVAEAAKNPAGELSVKLGEVYYGFGDYQNAVTYINAGLQKGQIKHLDEAYVYLGLAEQQLKDTAASRKAFAGLKTVPNMSPRVLKLWNLYAEREG
jgi:tetratricopeptide (TPR) repeat protein